MTEEEKELKVRLPISLYQRLHNHKIIEGTYIKDQVREALEHYFDNHENGDQNHD